MIPQDVIDEMQQYKPPSSSREDVVLTKIIYAAPQQRAVVKLLRKYAAEPQITYDPEHLEDTGWYFPVESLTLVEGNADLYKNQIPQIAYMTAKNGKGK